MSGGWNDPPDEPFPAPSGAVPPPPGPEYPQPHHDPRAAQYSALANAEAAYRARPPWKLGIGLRFVALLAAIAMLTYGLNMQHESRTHETRAKRSAARAQRGLARAQEQERIARSDLAAAQAAIGDNAKDK